MNSLYLGFSLIVKTCQITQGSYNGFISNVPTIKTTFLIMLHLMKLMYLIFLLAPLKYANYVI